MGYKKRQSALPDEVRQIQARIEHWRTTREKRTAMPAGLWEQAAGLARVHGIYRTAQALRLSYDSLKGRVLAAPGGGRGGQQGYRGFVDFGSAPLMGLGQPAAGPVVELSDADGAKLTIRLTGGGELDARALAESFWARRK
jgi:hypothetical protein